MSLLSNLFDRVTLRSHYRMQYNKMLCELLQSEYAPEVREAETLNIEGLSCKGALILIADHINLSGDMRIDAGTSLSFGKKRKRSGTEASRDT